MKFAEKDILESLFDGIISIKEARRLYEGSIYKNEPGDEWSDDDDKTDVLIDTLDRLKGVDFGYIKGRTAVENIEELARYYHDQYVSDNLDEIPEGYNNLAFSNEWFGDLLELISSDTDLNDDDFDDDFDDDDEWFDHSQAPMPDSGA